MERPQIQLLELLKAALWQKEIHLDLFEEDVDWKEIHRLAKEQALLGLIYDGMLSLPAEKRPNRISLLKWYGVVAEMETLHEKHIKTLKYIYEIFQEEKPVLMKGLSVSALYPNPKRRQQGDIDLYFGGKTEQGVNEFIKKAPFENIGENTPKHIEAELNGISVELHWKLATPINPFKKKCFDEMTNSSTKQLRTVNVGGVETLQLPLEINAVFLLLHMTSHFINSGLGLRQICDWVLFLTTYHKEMKREMLESMLSDLDLMKYWRLFARFSLDYLDADKDCLFFVEHANSKKVDKLGEVVFELGNFGQYNDRLKHNPKSYWLKKMYAFETNVQHHGRVFMVSPKDVLLNFLFVYLPGVFSRFKKGK
ncbi:MAG: nucleotidyltransferase family protein [Paludibacteraceae bacterium]|nr:nucleotidyltransferase family protein [Paludibacteraceae bacterium]